MGCSALVCARVCIGWVRSWRKWHHLGLLQDLVRDIGAHMLQGMRASCSVRVWEGSFVLVQTSLF